jgi:hypothetical protein
LGNRKINEPLENKEEKREKKRMFWPAKTCQKQGLSGPTNKRNMKKLKNK